MSNPVAQNPEWGSRKSVRFLIRKTFSNWHKHNAALLAAGLSYFTVFSMVPLLILMIVGVGMVFGEAAAEGTIVGQIEGLVGSEMAEAVQGMVVSARHAGVGRATFFGVLLLLAGASSVFRQLQGALNMIWGTGPTPGRFRHRVKKAAKNRLLAFSMVFVVGLLAFASFFMDAGLSLLRVLVGNILPVLGNFTLWKLASMAVSFVLLTGLTAMIFRLLPEADIAWGDVWVGALVTSALITVGRWIITHFFLIRNIKSIYGVAGSVIVIFVSVFLAAEVFLLGAEFTWVYATTYGSKAPSPRSA